MSEGRVRYVRNGDVRLAYRVYGDGEAALVWVPTVLSSIDPYDDPAFPWGAFVEQLSRVVRVVVYDGRGTGLSDPVIAAPSLDDRVQDLSCVFEAAGLTQASLFAPFCGGSQSLVFAASYPDRVRSLILFATAARFTQDPPDFPWGFTEAEVDAQLEDIENHWGEGALADLVFGASADVPGVRDQWGRIQSSFAGPTMAGLLWRTCIHDDTRDILVGVRAPAIVLARRGDHMVPFEASQALAVGLPNARFAELPPGEPMHSTSPTYWSRRF